MLFPAPQNWGGGLFNTFYTVSQPGAIRAPGLGATTLEEIEQIRQMLKNWQNAHPQEPKLPDVFEQLYIMEDAWRSLAAEPTSRAA